MICIRLFTIVIIATVTVVHSFHIIKRHQHQHDRSYRCCYHNQNAPNCGHTIQHQQLKYFSILLQAAENDSNVAEENDDDDDTMNMNKNNNSNNNSHIEKVWRSIKKPLLSIGAQKGPTIRHGNSLRQLLNDHTIVKVKIQLLYNHNNNYTSNDVSNDDESVLLRTYEQLKLYAIESGASPDIELLQVRASDRIVLIGLPGTQQQIDNGTYTIKENDKSISPTNSNSAEL